MATRKLRDWQEAGLIDAETAERIRAYEDSHARPLALWAVIGIAALAIGLGLVSIVAANWDAIPGMVRLAIHMALIAGGAAALWRFGPELATDKPWAHEAAIFVLGALGLTFMGHLGQVYQTSSPLWQPVGLWLLLFAPLLMSRGLSWLSSLMLMGALVFAVWNYAMNTAPQHDASDHVTMARIAAVLSWPVLMAGLAAWMRARGARDEFWRRVAQLALAYAVIMASVAAIASGMENFRNDPDSAVAVTGGLVVLAIGVVAALVVRRWRRSASGTSEALILAGAAAMPLTAYVLSGSQLVGGLLFLLFWTGIAAAALRAGWRGVFQLAVAVIAIRLIVLSFELASDLLTSGAGLIASGLLILGVAWVAVRVSKTYAPPAEGEPG